MARNYHQGKYKLINPSKCINGTNEVRFLSSYERYVWEWCDKKENVLRWGVETVVVPYYSSVKGRKARYLVDLYIEFRDKNGDIKKALCEVKPSAQCKPPRATSNKKRTTIIEEQTTWVTNTEKWTAAEKYAKDRGWEWMILTENEIFS